MADIQNIYNSYLSVYSPKTVSVTRHDTHKRSDLRRVYNAIVKLYKESPTYLTNFNKETKNYAIALKENARKLTNTIASVYDYSSDDLFNKKYAYSNNEDIASVEFCDDGYSDDENSPFELSVNSLATTQVNAGNSLAADARTALSGTYNFIVHSNNTDYEFEMNIGGSSTNQAVQEKIVSLINKSQIGINASLLSDSENRSQIVLESQNTGISDFNGLNFQVKDMVAADDLGICQYFGLDKVESAPTNSHFTLNGNENSTNYNTFTVNKFYEITLNGISNNGETATIGLKTDIQSFMNNIMTFVDGYNSFLHSVSEYKNTQPKSYELISEVKGITSQYRNNLDSIGLTVQEDGTLKPDENLLFSTVEQDDRKDQLAFLKDFSNTLSKKCSQISLDPMNYVEKKIVAYKNPNPGKNFYAAYVTSNYSGMLFNYFC